MIDSHITEQKTKRYKREIFIFRRWNFIFNIAEHSFDVFGRTFVSVVTVLPVFLSFLTDSKTIIGLLPATWVFFWMFPQILSAYFTEPIKQKKRIIVFLKIIYAFPWLILAIYFLVFFKASSKVALVVFFIAFAIHSLFGGLATPTWLAFVGKLISRNKRGAFYGFWYVIGTMLAVLGAFAIKYILAAYPFPVNFAICFLLAFSFLCLANTFLAITVEPHPPKVADRISPKEYFSNAKSILENTSFLRFVLCMMMLGFGPAMVNAFYIIYARENFNIPIGDVGTFTAILLISQIIAATVGGKLTDKLGAQPVFLISLLSAGLCSIWALITTSVTGLYVIFSLMGLYLGFSVVSYHNLILEMAPSNKRATYIGLLNTLRASFVAIGPIMGGMIIDHISYRLLFILATISTLISIALVIVPFKKKNLGVT
ncbi:MFS transporter [bacterium]|nr:MFS transporter [bacterium]